MQRSTIVLLRLSSLFVCLFVSFFLSFFISLFSTNFGTYLLPQIFT